MAQNVGLFRVLPLTCLVITATSLTALAQKDSVRVLNEVNVNSESLPVTKHTATPLQTLNHASLANIQALQLSDAVKHFSGVTVRDYGGVGGLKTITVRGMGSQHTAFSYDGVIINDNQTGQIDLSRFSMNNLTAVSLAIGNPDTILTTARAYASGSLLSIHTAEPSFIGTRKINAGATIKYGSFGLISPALIMENKWTNSVATSLLAEVQHAKGNYPYTLDYGGTTSKEKRSNTDVNTFHVEDNIFVTLPNAGKITSKIYYYQREQGLPGATIFYNPHSSQRLWERTFFAQSRYEKSISERTSTLFTVKYTNASLRYLDPDYLGSDGKLENIYRQREAYASGAVAYRANHTLQFALSSDIAYGEMDASLYQFPYPSRLTSLTAATIKYRTKYVDVQAGGLGTIVEESARSGEPGKDHARLSPSFVLGYHPAGNDKWLLRFFYKEIFRMPTFSDLYYTSIGRNFLKPENAKQLNAGITYSGFSNGGAYLSASVDAYHNRITHKIIALPTKNLFVWSMLNLGIVNINGMDIGIKAGQPFSTHCLVSAEATYTLQHAIDMTDPEAKNYKDQIAYTPLHSGAGTLAIHTQFIDIAYNVIYSGKRYSLNYETKANRLPGYTEHGVTLKKNFTMKTIRYSFSAEALNLADNHYEVVRNFPMPGKSYRITASARF